jgi:hypothetical protein
MPEHGLTAGVKGEHGGKSSQSSCTSQDNIAEDLIRFGTNGLPNQDLPRMMSSKGFTVNNIRSPLGKSTHFCDLRERHPDCA